MKIQANKHIKMSEIRKLLQLSSSTFGFSLPKKDAKHLGANKGDLIEVIVWDKESIVIRKLKYQKNP